MKVGPTHSGEARKVYLKNCYLGWNLKDGQDIVSRSKNSLQKKSAGRIAVKSPDINAGSLSGQTQWVRGEWLGTVNKNISSMWPDHPELCRPCFWAHHILSIPVYPQQPTGLYLLEIIKTSTQRISSSWRSPVSSLMSRDANWLVQVCIN